MTTGMVAQMAEDMKLELITLKIIYVADPINNVGRTAPKIKAI